MAQTSDWTGDPDEARPARLHVALWAGTAVLLVVSGLLLWSVSGQAVFTNVVSAALAWCF